MPIFINTTPIMFSEGDSPEEHLDKLNELARQIHDMTTTNKEKLENHEQRLAELED